MNSRLIPLPLLLVVVASQANAVGPTSRLYIMNYGEFGANTGMDMIQGVTSSSVNTGYPLDICIGVAGGDVRTMGYSGGDQGEKFDLNGNFIGGGPYTNSIQLSQLHDGTSDGSYNYSIDYTTGDVLRFDRNWASPTVVFNAAPQMVGAGWITMDTSDGSFWLSQWGGPDLVQHRSSTGTLLSSFNSGVLGSAGLAFDRIDGTLWMGDYNLNLYQFDQAGNLLQTQAWGGKLTGQWYGMEFETTPVPEPGTLALGLLALPVLRRRR
ncbi:MAG: hypothetical protein JSS65_03710 [Armatimonadetes bacterium]|nr:hypothetical protein [Armatimonadota bacterium]